MPTRRQFLHSSVAATLLTAGCSQDKSPTPSTTGSGGTLHYYTMPNAANVDVNLPMLDALWELDPVIRNRFPREHDDGIAALGISFARPDEFKNGDYYCTPNNSVAFAWSGGDGEHYSFIVRENRIDADSPVILTAPASGHQNHLLANSFRDFLRLGLRRGFFGLGQLAYNTEEALAAYGDPDWEPTKKSHYSVGFVPDERQVKILTFVAESLELEPLSYSPEEYARLQVRLDDLIESELE